MLLYIGDGFEVTKLRYYMLTVLSSVHEPVIKEAHQLCSANYNLHSRSRSAYQNVFGIHSFS